MVKAVIFDCFGVLAQEGWTPFKKEYFINRPEKLSKAAKLNKDMDIGRISFNQFIQGVAELAGTSYDFTYKYIDNTPTNTELLDYIKNMLKPKYKIVMLSNAGDDWTEKMFGNNRHELFDDIVLSFNIGFAKPDKNAYRIALERVSLKPEEAVFIDDQESYIVGAQEFGLKTIHYKDNVTTIKQLKRLLV